MPAILSEDVALNFTSTENEEFSSGSDTYPPSFPNVLLTANSSDDTWANQLPSDIYQGIATSFLGFFDDEDDNFGSPMPFDASENGLWNGRFVPPPPRPPFLEESIAADGITTCDLCSWARPVKSTFIFDGTIEKASELGWPLALIIVSVLSAIIGAILMITIVRYKRKKSSNRNETNAVQWWSRNKQRPHTQSIRRNNIYTGNPADSIRGLHHNIHHTHQHEPQNLHHQPHHRQPVRQQNNNHHHHNNNNNHGIDSCNWPNVTSFVVNS